MPTKFKNAEICGRLQMGAQCTHMFGGPQTRLSEAEWLTKELGRVSLDSDDWGDLRASIEIVCAKSKNCVVEELKAHLDAFEVEIMIDDLVNARSDADAEPRLLMD